MMAIPGAIIRLSVGLLGCLWLLGGIYGVAYAGSDHAWAAALGAAVTMLVGYLRLLGVRPCSLGAQRQRHT
jgi:hypothetical protein